MRHGMEPEKACQEIVKRIMKTNKGKKDFQVGFLALRKDGTFGSYAHMKGFNFAVYDKNGNRMVDSPFS